MASYSNDGSLGPSDIFPSLLTLKQQQTQQPSSLGDTHVALLSNSQSMDDLELELSKPRLLDEFHESLYLKGAIDDSVTISDTATLDPSHFRLETHHERSTSTVQSSQASSLFLLDNLSVSNLKKEATDKTPDDDDDEPDAPTETIANLDDDGASDDRQDDNDDEDSLAPADLFAELQNEGELSSSSHDAKDAEPSPSSTNAALQDDHQQQDSIVNNNNDKVVAGTEGPETAVQESDQEASTDKAMVQEEAEHDSNDMDDMDSESESGSYYSEIDQSVSSGEDDEQTVNDDDDNEEEDSVSLGPGDLYPVLQDANKSCQEAEEEEEEEEDHVVDTSSIDARACEDKDDDNESLSPGDLFPVLQKETRKDTPEVVVDSHGVDQQDYEDSDQASLTPTSTSEEVDTDVVEDSTVDSEGDDEDSVSLSPGDLFPVLQEADNDESSEKEEEEEEVEVMDDASVHESCRFQIHFLSH